MAEYAFTKRGDMQGIIQKLSLAVILLTLGLTVVGIWANVVGYSAGLLPNNHSVLYESFNRDAFHLGRFFVGVLFIVLTRGFTSVQAPLAIITALLMSVATGVLIIAHHQTLIDPFMLALCGAFVSSVGYSYTLWVFYLLAAKRMPTRSIVWCIVISLILETIISILVSTYLESTFQMLLVILAPFLSVACYFGCSRLCSNSKSLIEPQPSVTGIEKYALLVWTVIFTAALIFIRALCSINIFGEARTNYTEMAGLSIAELCVICATVLLTTFLIFDLLRKRLSLPLRYIISLAVILGGLQVMAFTSDPQFERSFDTVTTAVEIFSRLVQCLIIIECIRCLDIPAYRIGGITSLSSALFSMAWSHLIAPLEFATSSLVMIIVYVLLVFVILLFVQTSSSRKFSVWNSATNDASNEFFEFARRWNLSPRETEIFSLLMRGKKRAEIERECQLSEGTVKTHISNIYKKLDVHSKHEMRQLYERSPQ